MATTRTLLTLADYEQLPDDGVRRELDAGELITMTFLKLRHSRIQQRLNRILADYLETNPIGEVFTEPGCLIRDDPPTLRGPDVAFIRAARVVDTAQEDYIAGAPDLAIEVVSPSESASQLQKKVREYLESGGQGVWIVYPETREVQVFEGSAVVRVLTNEDRLQVSVLPGLSIKVEDVFG